MHLRILLLLHFNTGSLCSLLSTGYATTVCTLLREIDGGSIVRLTNEQLATALTHFTSAFAKTPPNNAPKLIYQVLLLYSSPDSGNNLTHQALDGITSWFDEHIAITTAPTPDQTFLLTASLSSFVSALRHSRSLGKTILKQITTSDSPTTATLRFERLTPFKIALSCTLASVNSNYKESSIAAMKELILEEIDFREKVRSVERRDIKNILNSNSLLRFSPLFAVGGRPLGRRQPHPHPSSPLLPPPDPQVHLRHHHHHGQFQRG